MDSQNHTHTVSMHSLVIESEKDAFMIPNYIDNDLDITKKKNNIKKSVSTINNQ